jgi:hypothetical protein
MIPGLPRSLGEAFERTEVAVLVTVDGAGHPVAAAARTTHDPREGCFDVAPRDAGAADPHVALLFAGDDGQALVQGTARPAGAGLRVRPERILHWEDGDLDAEPQLYDAHLEEVRSHHNQEPERPHEGPAGAPATWDERLDAVATAGGAAATLAVVGPDGFPFAVRVPVAVDAATRTVRVHADPVGAPLDAGPACLLLEDGEVALRGDLLEDAGLWRVRPAAIGRPA